MTPRSVPRHTGSPWIAVWIAVMTRSVRDRDEPRHVCREASERHYRPKRYHLRVKAANLSCRFLPLLPLITRNVKLPIRATRLEFSI